MSPTTLKLFKTVRNRKATQLQNLFYWQFLLFMKKIDISFFIVTDFPDIKKKIPMSNYIKYVSRQKGGKSIKITDFKLACTKKKLKWA